MFLDFFSFLRGRGLSVSMGEWLALTEALDKGFAHASISGFYQLCRAVLLKSESDYDKFDLAFLEYFEPLRKNPIDEIPKPLSDWLNKDISVAEESTGGDAPDPGDILAALEERLAKQNEEHNGGHHWIGTQGASPFGSGGYGAGGVRIEGDSLRQSAFTVAGDRRYRDFREDRALDARSFQTALRRLRRLSTHNQSDKTQLDLDASIQKTAEAGGNLRIVFDRPRKGAMKLLLLMDSGGSMDPYADLCAALFQAASKSDHWADLRIYYFHNWIRDRVYSTPRIRSAESLSAEWLLNNLGADYRLLIVGDALMEMSELTGGAPPTGLDRLRSLKAHFPRMVWLTPQRTKPQTFNSWGDSYYRIAQEVPMYPLTVVGLSDAVKRLAASR